MEFAAEDEEGLSVDDELGGEAAFFQVRRSVLGLRVNGYKSQSNQT
jgi:hypothetical protein